MDRFCEDFYGREILQLIREATKTYQYNKRAYIEVPYISGSTNGNHTSTIKYSLVMPKLDNLKYEAAVKKKYRVQAKKR